MILEVCASNYESALNAEKAGAHRIELCTNLNVGGLTPNNELLLKVTESLSIETFVLIRPRAGDFVYSNLEFERMKQSIIHCKQLGFAGIVSGILKKDNTLDFERTKEIIEISKPMSFTFHRAFDEVQDPQYVMLQLIDLGVDRILTSGQQPLAIKGLELLKELKVNAEDKIIIMPGSGINPKNAKQFRYLKFNEIHASATIKIEKINDDDIELISDIATIKSILKEINE